MECDWPRSRQFVSAQRHARARTRGDPTEAESWRGPFTGGAAGRCAVPFGWPAGLDLHCAGVGRRWLSRRALLLHVEVALIAPGCLAAGWWQATRALGGNDLSWVYSVEWPAFAIFAVVTGHIVFAVVHPESMRSMIKGWVTEAWAARYAPAWLQEETEELENDRLS